MVSYLLYMNWKPAYALVLVIVSLVTYFGGIVFERQDEQSERRYHLVWLFSLLGLLPLLLFKYYNFLNASISEALSAISLRFSLPGLNWAIPVGISFFTFQSVGYMLDVYHRRIQAEHNLLDYLLFVSFFPQIASGPISKANELLPQIKDVRFFNYSQAVSGLRYLLWGMFMKVVVADRLGIYVDLVFGNVGLCSGVGCLLASIFYSFQIYADFAGYTLIAVGIAKVLGFDLINNFRRPYFSTSVTEFWHRWHISLTRWLTQQIYIPLGGNRCGRIRTFLNIIITFLVCGLWHGANFTFVVWGILHALFQIFEKSFGWDRKSSHGLLKIFRICSVFAFVTLAWVFFRSPSLADAMGFFSHLFSPSIGSITAGSGVQLLYCIIALVLLIAYEALVEFKPEKYHRLMRFSVLRRSIYLALFTAIIFVGVLDGSSFIYVGF